MRYLTKSRFKLATECPTKLFYTGKAGYANQQMEDAFLAALADGGYQVGELAKCYYPEGVLIDCRSNAEAYQKTCELLKQDTVTLFEAAIRHENLFIRVDILVKRGNHFELIEVKAKSYRQQDDGEFLNKSGGIDSSWKSYIFDVAFQKHVLKSAYPKATVTSWLMLVDKNSRCATDGLNQKFAIVKDANNRKGIKVDVSLTASDLAVPILVKANTDAAVKLAYDNELQIGMPGATFVENIRLLSEYYQQDKKIAPIIGSKCKRCEFKCNAQDEAAGLKSGFKECWQEQLHFSSEEMNEPTVLNIWNYRGVDKCIEERVIKLVDITPHHIGIKESADAALSPSERQWLQVEKYQNSDFSPYFDAGSMAQEIAGWKFPLHFIDFETSAVAIPFYKGMSPYEGIAFQFSHHQVHADGRVEHAGQFLHTEPGAFPNFKFLRALKEQLDKDEGTIFRYSNHENTYLNMIRKQLMASSEVDKECLCKFIESITKSTGKSDENWQGDRCMVDLWELVKKYYYDPATNGSNSIKHVLPAMLNSSEYLKKKYSPPIYGSAELPSLNFTRHTWVKFDEAGKVIDPYKLLPKLFSDVSDHDLELLSDSDELNNGGIALTAYARLQFVKMSDYERKELQQALLKYCELDTLAMVMIYEGWRVMIFDTDYFF